MLCHVSPLCLHCTPQGDWEPKRNVQGTDAFNAWQQEKPDYYLANLAAGAHLLDEALRAPLTAHVTKTEDDALHEQARPYGGCVCDWLSQSSRALTPLVRG